MTDTTLRILHTEASLGWGGQEIRILTEAATFQRRGHAVHLLCDPRSNIFEAAPRYGIARTAMPMKRSLPNILRLRRFLREFRPDVVNVHSSKDHWLAALARIGLRERPAIVKTRHISAGVNRNAPTRWLYRRGADFVMTTGEEIVRQLTTDGFLPKDCVAAVPTGMDTARFSPGEQAAARAAMGLPADRVLFGIVATLRSWKGHAFLIEAFAEIARKRPAHLVIVGDGPQQENLEKQIATLGLTGQVTMTGRQDDVVPFLRALDLFVLPSYANEGVPQALLQAMACGIPVVTCPVGGIPEVIDGLEGVKVCPPKDAVALASAMWTLVEAPPAAATRTALRRRVEERYSVDIMYEKALHAFRTALRNR